MLEQSPRRSRGLPPSADAEAVAGRLRLTPDTALGALVRGYGALLVDDGWVRLLGSGSAPLTDIAAFNLDPAPRHRGALVVGHDVLGGFFALDLGGLSGNRGCIHYRAPATGRWEDLGFGYSGLIGFLLQGDLATFYADAPADTRARIAQLSLDRVLIAEGAEPGERSVEEAWTRRPH